MTPIAAVAASAGEIQEIELDNLIPSSFNPRKTFDPKSLQELADSIRQHGIQVPLLTRQVETIGKLGPVRAWEIIAGHRRHAAASLVGLDEVPCIVREMSDDEAREIALIDNLQREDMPALEEADAYESLRQQLGGVEQIAARVGKPVDYVTKRLKLVSLSALSRQALGERLITVDHAMLLARLGDEEQDAKLKWTLDKNAGSKTSCEKVLESSIALMSKDRKNNYYGYWEPMSVLELKREIEQSSGRKLAIAPWSLDDASLVMAAGPCTGCPSNTAHNTSLFGDLAIEEATCEDGGCYEKKRSAFVTIQIGAAKVPTLNLTNWIYAVKLSWRLSSVRPKWEKDGSGPDISKVLRDGQWEEAKKGSCPNVRNGVTVDWNELGYSNKKQRLPGETLLVCIAEGCKVHPKSYEKKAAGGSSNGGYDAKAEEAKREKNKQLAIAENKLRIALVSVALEGVTAIQASPLRLLALNALPGWEEKLKVFNALIPGIASVIRTAHINSPEFAKALALASIDSNELQVGMGGYSDDSKERRADLIETVRGLGYAGPDPWAKPAVAKVAVKKKTPAKKAAKKAAPAKKAASKGGRK